MSLDRALGAGSGVVVEPIQKLLAAPELVARTWAAARREGEIT